MTEATNICPIYKIETKFTGFLAVSLADGNYSGKNNADIANSDTFLEQWNGADQ